ncbi:hypothetical protein LguiA_021197 [Lonicera macranthoides]
MWVVSPLVGNLFELYLKGIYYNRYAFAGAGDLLMLLNVSSDEKILPATYAELRPPLGKHRTLRLCLSFYFPPHTQQPKSKDHASKPLSPSLSFYFPSAQAILSHAWTAPRLHSRLPSAEQVSNEARAEFRMKKYYSKIGTSSSSNPQNVGTSSTIPSINSAIPNVDIVEFIAVLLKTGNEVTATELVSSGTIQRVLDLFFDKHNAIIDYLFQECGLIAKILQTDKSPILSVDSHKQKVVSKRNKNKP